jgi:hypothetical protein
LMIASPKVQKMTLNPRPRERCAEFDKKRSARREALRHPPSSNTKSSRRTNILKDSDERIERTKLRYEFGMYPMK